MSRDFQKKNDVVNLKGCERSGTNLLTQVIPEYLHVRLEAQHKHEAIVRGALIKASGAPGPPRVIVVSKNPLCWQWSVFRYMRDRKAPFKWVRRREDVRNGLLREKGGWERFIRLERPLGHWSGIMNQWRCVPGVDILHVKHDDFLLSPHDALCSIARWMGCDPPVREVYLPGYHLGFGRHEAFDRQQYIKQSWLQEYGEQELAMSLQHLDWSEAIAWGYRGVDK